jgi:hypothetical protein
VRGGRLVGQHRPDALDRVRRRGEHVAARQRRVLLLGPLAAEDAQRLGVDAEHHAADAGPEDRAGAHHAGLGRAVDRRAGERLAVVDGRSAPHGVRLGVAGAVARLAAVAPRFGQHAPGPAVGVAQRDQRAEGAVAAVARGARQLDRAAQAGGVDRVDRFAGRARLVRPGRAAHAATVRSARGGRNERL